MELFAGKTLAERNKIIIAIVLGVLALIALYMAFGPSFRGKAVSVTPLPSPSKQLTADEQKTQFSLPPQKVQDLVYSTVPVVYNGASGGAPDTGRNIFAFYEPPPPTPYSPTPFPTPEPPKPTPTPLIQLAYVMPQNVYAGSGNFRLEVNGDKFTPDTKIYFNQSQMPTSFVSAQKITADIPAALIAGEGPKAVIVQSLDGKAYSNQVLFNVQAPPKPQFTYIGMIARKRYNNDTAYFMESGKQLPTSARLNDIVGGRFRLMSIAAEKTIVEDVNLGFRYDLPIVKATEVSSTSPRGLPTGFPDPNNFNPAPGYPGFPQNVQPRYVTPQNQVRQPRPQPSTDKKNKDTDKDVDDDDDTDN